jgi:acyl-CoA dehydrogenase
MSGIGRPRPIAADPAIGQTARRLFEAHCPPDVVRAAETCGFAADLWDRCAVAGLPWTGTSDGERGGVLDAVAVLHEAGRSAVPLPLAETGLLGGWLLHEAGLDPVAGAVSVPLPVAADGVRVERGRLLGTWAAVPWASSTAALVAVVSGPQARYAVAVDPAHLTVEPWRNLAGEPRDVVRIEVELGAVAVAEVAPQASHRLRLRGSLGRAALMAGAMSRLVELASEYASLRVQFGRPIGAQQAVQHLLALMAEQAAMTQAAVTVAADALDVSPDDPEHTVDVARLIAHGAQQVVTANAHQVLGAIGVTREHGLQLRTRRLWAWDREWADPARLAADHGRWMADRAGPELWAILAAARS